MRKDKDKHIYSEAELSQIFVAIARQKENVAKGILDERSKQKAARMNGLMGKLGMAESSIGDDVDLDEQEKILEEKIARVRAGELWQYGEAGKTADDTQDVKSPEAGNADEPVNDGVLVLEKVEGKADSIDIQKEPSALDSDSGPSSNKGFQTGSEPPANNNTLGNIQDIVLEGPIEEPDLSEKELTVQPENQGTLDLVLEGPVKEDSSIEACASGVEDSNNINTVDKTDEERKENESSEPEIVLEGPADEDDTVRAFLAVIYDGEYGAYAYTITARADGVPLLINKESCLLADRKETTIFMAANQVLKEIKKITEQNESFSAVIYAESSVCNLLKRTATYGLTGKFGKPALIFIQMSRELATQCFVRIADDEDAVDKMQVTERAKTRLLSERE